MATTEDVVIENELRSINDSIEKARAAIYDAQLVGADEAMYLVQKSQAYSALASVTMERNRYIAQRRAGL